jgi:serine/threonine protein kinase
MLQRGATFERYTVLEMLGRGGMGEVYAVYDSKLDRKAALKVLRRANEDYELRLRGEAQAMARLSHPNVVAVFDTGSVDGRVFVAMEFVQGQTLGAWQRAKVRPLAEILRMYFDAGRGLAAAHAAGLVHRDFKPDNVLVSAGGAVKVSDLGWRAPVQASLALVERARRVGYSPVTAEALLWLAQTMSKVGVPRAQCIERGEEAVTEADSGRDDLLRAEAANNTMH